MKNYLIRTGTPLLLVLVLAIVALGTNPFGFLTTRSVDAPPAVVAAQAAPFRDAIYQAVEMAKPAVVQVTNEQVGLGNFGQSTAIPVGVGSGIIFDDQGHILTNNHVVDGATKLVVSLPDGRAFDAQITGKDPQTDLAVIQINGSNLPVARLGDSSQIKVGDWVVAIGNALALPG
ncbi:MAG: trypsin-like peptidase domain-containing protein, partial [Anaerolineae bacterium]